MKHSHRILVRQWRLVLTLHGHHYGLTVRQLIEKTGASRASVYRDLRTLEDAGAPLARRTSNGQTRYHLLREAAFPPLAPSAMQIAALHLARAELEPLAGTGLVKELDALLAPYRPEPRQQSFQFARQASTARPQIMQALEHALFARQRVRLVYRAAARNGTESTLEIEPLLVNVVHGEPYVRAYCIERNAERTYKLTRIVAAEVIKQPATYRPAKRADDAFPHAVKAWSGELAHVKVKLTPAVAWRAAEYPLVPDQRVQSQKDGSALVEAQVAGLVEAARWVVAWGAAAEALEPPELRQAVEAELAEALSPYRGGTPGPGPGRLPEGQRPVHEQARLPERQRPVQRPGPAKTTPKKDALSRSRVTDRETRRA